MNYEEIINNVEAILPELKRLSSEAEQSCRLPSEMVSLLKKAGCFRMCMPKTWGGPELTSLQQIQVIEKLSSVSSEAGWCVMIGSDSGIYSGYLDKDVAETLYPSLDMVQAGWVYPGGKAIDMGNSYRVTGQWTFGSGIQHADRIVAGCVVFKDGKPSVLEDGRKEWIVVIGKQEDFSIVDNWDTTGLRGTGSHDYMTRNRIFPKEHSFSFLNDAVRDGVLWSRNDAFLRKMSGIPLGVCRSALDFSYQYLEEKRDFNTQELFRSSAKVQETMGRCELKYSSAKAYMNQALEKQWDMLSKGQSLDNKIRADVWLSRVNVFRTCREVIVELYDMIGGSAIRVGKTPLDKALRDSNTWCQHVVGKESGIEASGNLLLNDKVSLGFPML